MNIFRSISCAFALAFLATAPAFAFDAHPQLVAMSKHHHHKHHKKQCRDSHGRFKKC